MVEEYDFLFKSIVVGDGGVGKTALTLRFSKGFFTEDYKMTIGVDFHVKTISIDSNEGPLRAKLQIWDTGGQERFSSIRPMYYRGSLGALLIFDLTNSSSFVHLPGWIEEIRANVKTEIPLLLVGNKSDLVDQRAVSLEEINTFTRDFNLYYMETSAKTGEGVGDCFYILACLMIGSGVPDQLISNSIVFNPGQISSIAPETYLPPSPQVKINNEYSAPPVPEPLSTLKQESSFEPEPEFDYSAPPVPEPSNIAQSNPNPPFESEFEPEIPIPDSKVDAKPTSFTEFEFKTPDDILAENESKSPIVPSIDSPLESSSEETYTPKATPFTSNIPVPAPTPKGFQIDQAKTSSESSPAESTPFLTSREQSPPKSDSLADYMPEPIISKKDKKKIDKQKKKEEKEKKAQEEKERQQKLIEEMKKAKKAKKDKPKKEKKEKSEYPDSTKTTLPGESQKTPSLFQTLTQKDDETEKPQSSTFVPFSKTVESQDQEKTKLRIIPNATNIETKPSSLTPIQSSPQSQSKISSSKKKELIICKSCGAMLSSDYAFCNKCGSQL